MGCSVLGEHLVPVSPVFRTVHSCTPQDAVCTQRDSGQGGEEMLLSGSGWQHVTQTYNLGKVSPYNLGVVKPGFWLASQGGAPSE